MDLDDAAEELYAGSPDDFVERRTALVAQARAAKDRPLAKAVGALRRPTRTAWLLNRLARDDAAGVAELLALGASLADAQRRGSGADLRRLSAERRTLVDRLARDAVRRGAEAGYAAADGALQEVSQSLQAALGDADAAELLRRGRLTTAVSYGGFGGFGEAAEASGASDSDDLVAAMAASLAGATGGESPSEPEPRPEPDAEAEPESAETQERRRRAEEAEAAWQQAASELGEVERAADEATARADELADRIEALQAELGQAESEEAAARAEARTARRRHQAAASAAEEAERARDEARAALDR